jgi:hypothetical protein
MSDRLVATRLRGANPVVPGAAAAPPSAVFERIIATPGGVRHTSDRSARGRRPLVVALLALLVLCGIAAATTISVHYFSAAGDAPLPPAVRGALERAASHYAPVRKLRIDEAITAYSFADGSQRGRVYVAPYATGRGFCAALDVGGRHVQAGCSFGAATHERTLISDSIGTPWDVALAPDVHAMLGRLGPAHADDEVRIAFEDGTSVALPKHGRWFAYAVAGKHTDVGHRPVELRFLREGKVIRRERLAPTSYNTLVAAEALVPRGDGSDAQTAIRQALLAQVRSNLSDGGLSAAHTRLDDTRLVRALPFQGTRVLVYYTPISAYPIDGKLYRSGIVTALLPHSRHPILQLSGIAPAPTPGFRRPAGCTCTIPKHPKATFALLLEGVPTGVARVEIQMSNGKRHAASLYDRSRQWIWLGRTTRTLRPTAVIGLDASGHVVTHLALHALWR